jgi:hypothetical protein
MHRTFIVKRGIHLLKRSNGDSRPAEDKPMANLQFPTWQKPYREALLEPDPKKLQPKMEAAENAIFLRMQELAGRSDIHAERRAIQEALSALRSLQIERLNYPKLPGESTNGVGDY